MATEVKADSAKNEGGAATEQALMQMLTGAWVTQAVATAARLGIPDLLVSGPKTAEELATDVKADPSAVRRLMRALAGVGVFAPSSGGKYGLTDLSDRLRDGFPGSLKHMFIAETDGVHWRSWEKVADAVRTGLPRPQAVFDMPAFDYYAKNVEEGEQFGRAMENVSGFAAHAVLEAYDFGGIQTLADVGGGNGSMVLAVLGRHPEMRGIVCDLPYIEKQAAERIQAAGASGRCGFEAGDFFERAPQGADAHLLKFILHDWNDEDSIRILRSCRAALPPNGRLLVIEVVVPEEQGRPDFSHWMDLNMLVMTGGQERTSVEYESLLRRGGFRIEKIVTTAGPFSVIDARPV